MQGLRAMLPFDWITPELALGGRIEPALVPALARVHGITAIVDVRAEACDDVSLLAAHGIALCHVPAPDHHVPERLDDGVAFAAAHLARGARVLVHCEHGIGRSALLALCVLVIRGHEPLAALALAKARRAVVSPSPAQLDAWAAWLAARGHAVPSFDELAAIAYRRAR